MKVLIMSLGLLLIAACHPLAMFRPKAINNKYLSTKTTLKSQVHIAIDQFGIPFIKSSDLHAAIYGLGFMHARDRLFQLDLMRHAALGRLSEIFGKKTYAQDRKLRLLTYRLPEQMARLAPKERDLLEAYSQGVNDGARQRGRSAEHFILGIDFEALTPEQVVAIGRLQAWSLGSDLMAEIGRLSVVRSALSEPAKLEIISSVNDRGSAIMGSLPFAQKSKLWSLPRYLSNKPQEALKTPSEEVPHLDGASNAWVVAGHMTQDGHAYLMNDPHLLHTWPSNFYIATVEGGGMKATGATFVGLPSVLIGASNQISWGVTASYLNTQDAVLLNTDPKDPTQYFVDGQAHQFKVWPQKFCLNKKGRCKEENFYESIFGPVIDNSYDNAIQKSDKIAVQWTGFLIKEHAKIATTFVELAQAPNVIKAAEIVNTMTLPGVNMVLADTAQNIGYAYAGLVPTRDLHQAPLLPLDGNLGLSLWQNGLEPHQKPRLLNPSQGYIITANQNIFSANASPELQYGQQGAPPFRALQIMRRFTELLARDHKLNFIELAQIQLDTESVEARELSAYLGQACTHAFANGRSSRKDFARLLTNFDGRFTTESLSALPFDMMLKEVIEKKIGPGNYNFQLNFAVSDSLRKAYSHEASALFEDKDFKALVESACEGAYQRVVKKAGIASWKWRWGRHHSLRRQSPLGKAPVIGGFFRDRKREVPGHSSAPMAEFGLPVMGGANMRFLAKMSSPPHLELVLDSGNSGVVGHPNSFDQVELWHKGQTIEITTAWDKAKKMATSYFELLGDQSSSSSRR